MRGMAASRGVRHLSFDTPDAARVCQIRAASSTRLVGIDDSDADCYKDSEGKSWQSMVLRVFLLSAILARSD